jgi:hypothetical protein
MGFSNHHEHDKAKIMLHHTWINFSNKLPLDAPKYKHEYCTMCALVNFAYIFVGRTTKLEISNSLITSENQTKHGNNWDIPNFFASMEVSEV